MNVFLCESIHPRALELLRTRGEVIGDWEQIGRAEVIISRNLKLPRPLLQRAPGLKIIAVHGTGSDGIDLEYCREKQVTVLYVPFQNSDSVAELIVGLTLALLRKLQLADRLVTSGRVTRNAPPELFGQELRGKTVGLIGVGDIARRVARIMIQGFGCRAIGYDPHFPAREAAQIGIQPRQSPEEVMGEADIISLGVHYSPSTANLINARRLALCKPTAILVNASRGGVVDEEALYHALRSGQLAGAACDVWLHEPPTLANPLVGLDNVLATPHLGANTDQALARVGIRMVEQIFTVWDGGKAEYEYKAQ